MAGRGAAGRWGGHSTAMRSGCRTAVAIALGIALVAGGQSASADPDDADVPAAEPADQQPADDASDGEGTSEDGGNDADSDTADSDTDDAPATHGFGGAPGGPADLMLLDDDPDYPVKAPPEGADLPRDVDAVPGYLDNTVCDPVERPGVTAFANLIGQHYELTHYTTARNACATKSLHHEGRALDWTLDAYDPMQRRIGDDLVVWLTENDGEMAARFGISQIIWNHRVWNAWTPDQWFEYVGVSPHSDHIHFSFSWDGAQMRTSWWTGVPVIEPDLGPCVAAGSPATLSAIPRTGDCPAVEVPDAVSDDNDAADDTGTVEDGSEDEGSDERADSQESDLSVRAPDLPDYLVTAYTPVKETVLAQGDTGPAVELLQESLGMDEADGVFGAETEAALHDYTSDHPWLLPSTSTDPLLWHILEREQMVTLDVRHITLEPGDDGPVVELLQDQLGVEVDGQYGEVTEAAVREAQAEEGIAETGQVDGHTWAAVDTGQRTSPFTIDEMGRTWYRGSIYLTVEDLPEVTS